MYLYLLGGAVKKYGLCIRIKGKPVKTYIYLVLYCVTSLMNFAITYVYILITKEEIEASYGNYCFIFNLLGALSLLLFFANLKIKSNKFTTMLGVTSFGVYIISEQSLIKDQFIREKFTFLQTINPFVAILSIIGISIAIYVICTVIEYLRQLLFKLLRIPKFTAWIQKIIEDVYHKIGNKKDYNQIEK